MHLSETPEELVDQGRYKEALEALHTTRNAAVIASGPDGCVSLLTEIKIAQVLSEQGRYDEALTIFAKCEKKLGPFSDSFSWEIYNVKENIANVYSNKNDYNYSLSIYEEIYNYSHRTLGPDNAITITASRNSAKTLRKFGKHNEALNILNEVYNRTVNNLGPTHEDSLLCYRDIALVFLDQCKFDTALIIFKQIYAILNRERPKHCDTLLAKCDIANTIKRQCKYSQALQIYEEVYRQGLPPRHPETLNILQNMAEIFDEQGEYDAALLFYQEIYSVRSVECPFHRDTVMTQRCIITILLKKEQYSEALRCFKCMQYKMSSVPEIQCGLALEIQQSIALLLFDDEKYREALKIFNTVYYIQNNSPDLGPDHPDTLMTKINLGGTYLSLSKYEEAMKIFADVLEKIKLELGQNDPACITVQNNIAALYAKQGKYNEAFRSYCEIYESQAKALGLEHPSTLQAERNLDVFSDTAPTSKFIRAIIEGDIISAKFHIDIKNADVNEKNFSGSMPIHIASAKGDSKSLKLLLSKGAIYDIKNRRGKKPVDLAATKEIKNLFDSIEMLFKAVREGDEEVICRVIDADAGVINARDEEGNTCLYWACVKKYTNTSKLLLSTGADPTLACTAGRCLLHTVIEDGNEEMVEILLEHITKNNPASLKDFVNDPINSMTPLHIAAMNGNLQITRLLLNHGANVSAKIKDVQHKINKERKFQAAND